MANNNKFCIGKKERNIMSIMGIDVDGNQDGEVLDRAWSLIESSSEVKPRLKKGNPRLIVTPNPEIVSRAQNDSELAEILNSASLSAPDAVGIIAAERFLNLPASKNPIIRLPLYILEGILVGFAVVFAPSWLRKRSDIAPGRLLACDLIRLTAKNGRKVFLLGGRTGAAELAASRLSTKFQIPESRLGFATGPWLDGTGNPQSLEQEKIQNEVVKQINSFCPDLLLVGFGAPKQEKWLAKNLDRLSVKVAMTVGGMIDYTAGILPPPPRALSELGFEWLWRLFTQPARVGRILTATVVFPWQVFLWKLKNK